MIGYVTQAGGKTEKLPFVTQGEENGQNYHYVIFGRPDIGATRKNRRKVYNTEKFPQNDDHFS